MVAVAPNSPAARGGLRAGDIITEVKGVQIQNAA
ncbi:MAG TPA: PDZ domain-containing protein [Coleofasciculaceae cyanobacterium]